MVTPVCLPFVWFRHIYIAESYFKGFKAFKSFWGDIKMRVPEEKPVQIIECEIKETGSKCSGIEVA